MKVEILKSIASEAFAFKPRQIVELSDDLARVWAKSGIARIVGDECSGTNSRECAAFAPPKRKRGRPRKHPLPT